MNSFSPDAASVFQFSTFQSSGRRNPVAPPSSNPTLFRTSSSGQPTHQFCSGAALSLNPIFNPSSTSRSLPIRVGSVASLVGAEHPCPPSPRSTGKSGGGGPVIGRPLSVVRRDYSSPNIPTSVWAVAAGPSGSTFEPRKGSGAHPNPGSGQIQGIAYGHICEDPKGLGSRPNSHSRVIPVGDHRSLSRPPVHLALVHRPPVRRPESNGSGPDPSQRLCGDRCVSNLRLPRKSRHVNQSLGLDLVVRPQEGLSPSSSNSLVQKICMHKKPRSCLSIQRHPTRIQLGSQDVLFCGSPIGVGSCSPGRPLVSIRGRHVGSLATSGSSRGGTHGGDGVVSSRLVPELGKVRVISQDFPPALRLSDPGQPSGVSSSLGQSSGHFESCSVPVQSESGQKVVHRKDHRQGVGDLQGLPSLPPDHLGAPVGPLSKGRRLCVPEVGGPNPIIRSFSNRSPMDFREFITPRHCNSTLDRSIHVPRIHRRLPMGLGYPHTLPFVVRQRAVVCTRVVTAYQRLRSPSCSKRSCSRSLGPASSRVHDSCNRQCSCSSLYQRSRRQKIRDTMPSDVSSPPHFGGKSCLDIKRRLDSFKDQLRGRSSFPGEALISSRRPVTVQVYLRDFERFTDWLGFFRLPLDPNSLATYIWSLRTTKHGRYARAIMSAVKFVLSALGLWTHEFKDPRLLLCVDATLAVAPALSRPPRPPFRWSHLLAMCTSPRDGFLSRDIVLCILSLFCYLRSCEVSTLSKEDLTFSPDGTSVTVRVARAKQPPGTRPVFIAVRNIPGAREINVIKFIKDYVSSLKGTFLFPSKKPGSHLSPNGISQAFAHRMVVLKVPGRWTSHCLRIGAACFAAERGLSQSEIKALGGWRSDAFLCYIRDLPIVFRDGPTLDV